jgi:O-antigen ligase
VIQTTFLENLAGRVYRCPRRLVAWGLIFAILLSGAWAIAVPGPFFTAAAVAAAVAIIGVIRYPWLGLLLLVLSVPAQDFGAVQVAGQSITLTRAFFPLAVLGYFVSLVINQEPLRGSRVVVPFAILVGTMLASLTWATATAPAAAETARWMTAIVSFVIATHFLIGASQRRLLLVIGIMALAGVFQATYGVIQSVFALGPESFRVGDAGSRAFGTFGQPNSYAGYLEIVFFPVFWMGIFLATRIPERLRRYRLSRLEGRSASSNDRFHLVLTTLIALVYILSATVILSGIGASFSRGAWLGVAAGGAVSAILFHRWIRRGALIVIPLAALVLAGGLPGFLPDAFTERVTTGFADLRPFDAANIAVTDENFAAAERMAHWQAGWRMFVDHPFSGVGVGNFNERYDEYFVRQQFQFTRGHAHNYYIHLLSEVGLTGLIAYVTLIVSVLVLSLQVVIRAHHGFERMLALGVSGTIVSVLVHNVFENLHVLNLSVQLAVIWAIAIAAHRQWHASHRLSSVERDR